MSSIVGTHKGKQFKIYFVKQRFSKSKSNLIIEINKKKHNVKDSREIVRLLNA